MDVRASVMRQNDGKGEERAGAEGRAVRRCIVGRGEGPAGGGCRCRAAGTGRRDRGGRGVEPAVDDEGAGGSFDGLVVFERLAPGGEDGGEGALGGGFGEALAANVGDELSAVVYGGVRGRGSRGRVGGRNARRFQEEAWPSVLKLDEPAFLAIAVADEPEGVSGPGGGEVVEDLEGVTFGAVGADGTALRLN